MLLGVAGLLVWGGVVVYPLLAPRTVLVRVEGERSLEVNAAVAAGPVARYLGLMFRETLAPDQGMWFEYDRPRPRAFWMKYTRIPLDIVFIGPDLEVLNVAEADPCEASPCRRYRSDGPAQFVLEVRRGLCREAGVRPGARVWVGQGGASSGGE